MDLTELFVSRNLLLETGRNAFFKNIVFVSREDKDYLQLLGKGMFDGFDESLITELKDLKQTSYLCKTLQKESQYQTEEYKYAYWNSDKDLINEKIEEDCIIEATVHEKLIKKFKSPYKGHLKHENIILYFPVLESWIQYMLPKMQNETFETREIIKCLSIPAESWKQKRKMLMYLKNHDLIEKVTF